MTVYLGIALEICSTLSGTIGKLMIRYGALTEMKNLKKGRRLGLIGLIISTTGSPALDISAYTFAPQALIAPFAGLDVAWNALLAPCVLGETLTRMKLYAICLVFAGVSCTLFFVDTNEPEYTTEYCRNLLFSWRTFIYLIVLFVFIIANLRLQQRLPKGDNKRGLSLGVTGGTLAGNMFCVKLFGEILEQSFNENGFQTLWDVFITQHTGLFILVLSGAIFFALSNVYFVATGMREFEALFMVTVFEGSMIISGCVCGTIVMKDFDEAGWWNLLGFSLCVLTMMLGIYVLFVAQMAQVSSLFSQTASIAGVGPNPDDVEQLLIGKSDASLETIVPHVPSATSTGLIGNSASSKCAGQNQESKPKSERSNTAAFGRQWSAGSLQSTATNPMGIQTVHGTTDTTLPPLSAASRYFTPGKSYPFGRTSLLLTPRGVSPRGHHGSDAGRSDDGKTSNGKANDAKVSESSRGSEKFPQQRVSSFTSKDGSPKESKPINELDIIPEIVDDSHTERSNGSIVKNVSENHDANGETCDKADTNGEKPKGDYYNRDQNTNGRPESGNGERPDGENKESQKRGKSNEGEHQDLLHSMSMQSSKSQGSLDLTMNEHSLNTAAERLQRLFSSSSSSSASSSASAVGSSASVTASIKDSACFSVCESTENLVPLNDFVSDNFENIDYDLKDSTVRNPVRDSLENKNRKFNFDMHQSLSIDDLTWYETLLLPFQYNFAKLKT